MGTIVINQTDCKQNVVLQSSLDGITGGYYDASGVWHDIGYTGKNLSGKKFKCKESFTGYTTYPVEIPFPAFMYKESDPGYLRYCAGLATTSSGTVNARVTKIAGTDIQFWNGSAQTSSEGIFSSGSRTELGADVYFIFLADFPEETYDNNFKTAYEKLFDIVE